MENFAVYSKDKALLKAFEEKLKEKRIKRFDRWDENDNDMVYILISRNNYQYANHDGGESAARIFDLPEQWNKAVSYLEDNTKPEFKVNDWVVWEGMYPTIGQIKEKINNDGNSYILKNTANKELGYSTCHKDYLRHATKEEIYNHLISQTDLKVGDEIIDYDGVKGKIEEISLYSKLSIRSNACMKHFRDCGDHLVVKFGGLMLPINYVRKVNSFTIKTDRNEYTPQIENGEVSVGCVKNVSEIDLRRIRKVNEFCQEKEINLLFKPDGKIQVIVGDDAGFIEYDQINELIQKLKKDEQQ
jgi:hypothetical protein